MGSDGYPWACFFVTFLPHEKYRTREKQMVKIILLNASDKTFEVKKQKRKEYLNELRQGAFTEDNPTEFFTYLACSGYDQSIQKAAISGLTEYYNTKEP
jgi:hypothetical protein